MRVSHVTRMNLFRYQRLFLHVSSALTPDIRFFFKSLISGSLFRYQRLFSGFFLWVTFQISTSLLRCVYCSSTRYLPVGGSRQNEEKKKCETVEWISATAISCTVPSGVWIFVQHAATRCNTLQHAATHRTTLQHTASHCDCCLVHGAIRCVDVFATRCNTLQHTEQHCNTLRHTATAVSCSVPSGVWIFVQHAATRCNTLQHTTTHCSTLQNTATHYNVHDVVRCVVICVFEYACRGITKKNDLFLKI